MFGRLRAATQPDIEQLIKTQPQLIGEGFSKAHFTLEFRTAMNILGSQDPKVTTAILEKLKIAANPDLADFAGARLGGK